MNGSQVLLSTHPKLQPNVSTYVALMRPLGLRATPTDGAPSDPAENKTLAFSLYEELLAADIPPDHAVYNTLIAVCGEAKDFEAAERVFTEMREKVTACYLTTPASFLLVTPVPLLPSGRETKEHGVPTLHLRCICSAAARSCLQDATQHGG
jgi:pentatricopeptide repeat protein